MVVWSPRCYKPSFEEIGPPVSEKIFEGFLPYMGVAAILVKWPASCYQIFIFLYLKAFIKNGSDRHSSFWENPVWILHVLDLGPRSRNDIDLKYSHTFIYSIRCLLLLTVRSLVAIVSEKSGKRMIKRKWKVYSHFLPWFLVAANTYWTMNRDG